MSRWQKRSQEDQERILHDQNKVFFKKSYTQLSYEQLRSACDAAKRRAGHEGVHCSACDLRCPGCPLEAFWPKQ